MNRPQTTMAPIACRTAGSAGSRFAGAPLETTVVPAAGISNELYAEWQTLAEASPNCSWSMLPGVFRNWLETLGPPARTSVLAARDGQGQLCGLVAIVQERVWRGPSCVPRFDYAAADRSSTSSKRPRLIPLRQITTPASIPATTLWVGPLCLPGFETAVYDSVAACLARRRGWDVLVFAAYEAEQPLWLESLRRAGLSPLVHRLDRLVRNNPALRPFEQIVAGESRNFRRNIRRARQAAEEVGLNVRLHVGTAAMDGILLTLAQVAGHSWKREGRSGQEVSIPYEGKQQVFFERLLVSSGLGATPVVAVADSPEGPVAIAVTLRHFRKITGILIFMDGRSAPASPGILMVGAIIDWAAANGVERFEFNATHDWVRHLAGEERTLCNIVAFATSPAGRLASFISRTTGRLK